MENVKLLFENTINEDVADLEEIELLDTNLKYILISGSVEMTSLEIEEASNLFDLLDKYIAGLKNKELELLIRDIINKRNGQTRKRMYSEIFKYIKLKTTDYYFKEEIEYIDSIKMIGCDDFFDILNYSSQIIMYFETKVLLNNTTSKDYENLLKAVKKIVELKKYSENYMHEYYKKQISDFKNKKGPVFQEIKNDIRFILEQLFTKPKISHEKLSETYAKYKLEKIRKTNTDTLEKILSKQKESIKIKGN